MLQKSSRRIYHSVNLAAKQTLFPQLTRRAYYQNTRQQKTARPDANEHTHPAEIAYMIEAKAKYRRRTSVSQTAKRRLQDSNNFTLEGNDVEILEYEAFRLLTGTDTASDEFSKTERAERLTRMRNDAGPPASLKAEIELDIVELSSTGDGLALSEDKDHVFVVPTALPGDRLLVRPWRWNGIYTTCDNLKIITPSPLRKVEPKCKYFGECSGCQFQMMSYEDQLVHKREIIARAYKDFSSLDPSQIPQIEDTMPSPRQYDYRTKLTPHFPSPPGAGFRGKHKVRHEVCPPFGFNMINSKKVVDIESCPIATPTVQDGLANERDGLQRTFQNYHLGATVLIRETTKRKFGPSSDSSSSPPWTEHKTYSSDNNGEIVEYIDVTSPATATSPATTRSYALTNSAGAFFQNNNSILNSFTSYIYQRSIPPGSTLKYLLDAYCGCGLFTFTLSPLFKSALGIDISPRSIENARENCDTNPAAIYEHDDGRMRLIPQQRQYLANSGFISADAADLFSDVPYPAAQTVCVIDPPRKGCSIEFLQQLRRYGPQRLIYVSCNVHSQARDVGVLVNGFDGRAEDGKMCKYKVESLRGCDFFPQTSHVESVCILNRVEQEEESLGQNEESVQFSPLSG